MDRRAHQRSGERRGGMGRNGFRPEVLPGASALKPCPQEPAKKLASLGLRLTHMSAPVSGTTNLRFDVRGSTTNGDTGANLATVGRDHGLAGPFQCKPRLMANRFRRHHREADAKCVASPYTPPARDERVRDASAPPHP